MTCIFCEIVAGRAPAQFVRRWDDAVAFVPLNPVTDGHVLVVPNFHAPNAISEPDAFATAARRASTYAGEVAWGTLQAFNFITSAGAAATQTVDHLHLHVVPREFGDGLTLPWSP